MGANIDDEEVERLIAKLAAITGETPREVVRRALTERIAQIEEREKRRERIERYMAYLKQEVWPALPAGELGRVLTRDEEDRILGYGSEDI